MPQLTVRALAASAAFALGLAAVCLSGLLAPAEGALAEWPVPTSGISLPSGPLVTREEGDTQKVYETVLREKFGGDGAGRLLVIRQETTHCSVLHGGEVTEFEGAAGDTLAAYNALLNFPKRLRPMNGLEARHVFLPYEEYQSLFRNLDVDGWGEFGRRFPNSSGYVEFSSIGFNRAGDEAFLYAARSCGGLCGGGWHFLLRKTARGWEIERSEVLWVS